MKIDSIRHVAWIGAAVGVISGIAGRIVNYTPANKYAACIKSDVGYAMCKAARATCYEGPQHAVIGPINTVMQVTTKTGLNYLPVVVPVLLIGGELISKTCKASKDFKIGSLWKEFNNQVKNVPIQQALQVVTITALTFGTTRPSSSWLIEVFPKFISTIDPSGHVMVVTTLGVALSAAVPLLKETGHGTLSHVATAASLIIGVANVIFLNHTIQYCHSIFEVYDGIIWTVAILGTSLSISFLTPLISKTFG